jgi:hypothetical protein
VTAVVMDKVLEIGLSNPHGASVIVAAAEPDRP